MAIDGFLLNIYNVELRYYMITIYQLCKDFAMASHMLTQTNNDTNIKHHKRDNSAHFLILYLSFNC